jgi:hypothetical protein
LGLSTVTILILLLVILGGVAAVLVALARRSNGGRSGVTDDLDDAQPPPPDNRPKKSVPLKLSLHEFRGLRLNDFRNDGRALRDFSELVTVATLAAEGWKKLPSKLQGGQGLDVLVVRDVRGAGGYEARAIEVKTNNASFNPATMSDARVQAALGHLHDIGAFDGATLEQLLSGLQNGPPYFRKEIWRHHLDTGVTTVSELDEHGHKIASQLRSSAHLMDALYQMIKQLDHNADYVDRKPVDAPIAEEVVMASARRLKPVKRSFFGAYTRAFTAKPKRRA